MNTKIYKIIFGLLLLTLVVFIFQSAFNGKKIVLVYAQTVIPISDCVGLQDMNINLTADYYLTQSFSCSATAPGDQGGGDIWTDNLGFEPVGDLATPFTGSFDGDNHTITDLFIYRTSASRVGLFGSTSSGSVVSDVSLVDVNITGLDFVGGLIGDSFGAVSDSSSVGSVTGLDNFYAGGLIGRVFSGSINNSYSSGSVNGNKDAGGLIGAVTFGSINNSYSTADVTITLNRVGGLIGYNYGGAVSDSYSIGSVSGGSFVGGFIGVIGGGGGSCSNSFWDTETSGQLTSACSAEGKTSVEMTTQSTFTSGCPSGNPCWDFTVISIWKIISNSGLLSYPCLEWQPDSTCIFSSVAAPALGNFMFGMGF